MNMKNIILPLALGMTATAFAGESYSAKSAKEVIPPAPECSLQWFLGASAGYLTDADEEMYHLQFGVEKICPNKCSHALFLEVGFTELDDSVDFGPQVTSNLPDVPFGEYELETQIVPITLNYKYECSLTQNLNWYIGAGAGIALVDMDIDSVETSDSESFDDEVFYAQAFAGLTYNFCESFEAFGGVRYIYMDDADLTGLSEIDDKGDIDGDVLVELGLRYNF
ncbi:hypothetical protein Rhal01_03706 [Rubritalea halochordaticola]|uniref:Outer membrane protein beta-barrel domain-containing protein n=2 Tax=Rubritalea halochordaticola TaxID=714537 RepID=A0ABP9V695_9BACT